MTRLKGIINFSNHIMQRYLPDPYLFVVLLTFVVFILGLIFTGSSPIEMVQFWGEGFLGIARFFNANGFGPCNWPCFSK